MDITWWQVRSATAGVLCVRLLCFSLVHSFGSFLIQTKKKKGKLFHFFSMKMWTTKKFESKKKLNFWWESCRLQHFFVLCILLTWQSHLSPGDDTNDIFFFTKNETENELRIKIDQLGHQIKSNLIFQASTPSLGGGINPPTAFPGRIYDPAIRSVALTSCQPFGHFLPFTCLAGQFPPKMYTVLGLKQANTEPMY